MAATARPPEREVFSPEDATSGLQRHMGRTGLLLRSELSARGTSFGTAAAAYDRLRFLPDAEALDWLLAGDERRVLDLGAGTGQVTQRLLERGVEVVAVEPDDQMRALLAVRRPSATVLAGTAEAIPLGEAAVDAVLVGAAWHWFDAASATAEIARVLRPGGRLGLLFTVPDVFVGWVRELHGLEGLDPGASEPGRAYSHLSLGPSFSTLEQHTVRGRRMMTAGDIEELFTTFSEYRIADLAGQAAIHRRVREVLAGRGDPIELPTLTEAWRAVRG